MTRTTITAACGRYGISSRTLRYWEQIGLIRSERETDSACRAYTEDMMQRIGQILILRRMRIPLSEVGEVLSDPSAQKLLTVLQTNIARIDAETDALCVVRQALSALANRAALYTQTCTALPPGPQELAALLMQAAPPPCREEMKMSDLRKAEDTLAARMDVRFVYLPPMTVAASHYTGPNPEDSAGKVLDRFVAESGLMEKMPGLRLFGFNNPSPESPGAMYGYEYWVTVPEDFEVPAPLEKKRFAGGLYAAHAIRMGDFHEWAAFMERMQADPAYAIRWREPYSMGGCLEEHLNAPGYYRTAGKRGFAQIDLMIPVEEK